MSRTEEIFIPALSGKKIPVLTLDNKWHQLFTQVASTREITEYEEKINELLKRQGKLNTEFKDIKRLKKKLMEEIVNKAEEASAGNDEKAEKKIDDNKRLINDCNDKLEKYQDELLDLPKQIEELNKKLMLITMEECYTRLKENNIEIEETSEWVAKIRIELKKKLIRKQEKEIMNQALYAYMHDIFGADVIEIFDMKYLKEKKLSNDASRP